MWPFPTNEEKICHLGWLDKCNSSILSIETFSPYYIVEHVILYEWIGIHIFLKPLFFLCSSKNSFKKHKSSSTSIMPSIVNHQVSRYTWGKIVTTKKGIAGKNRHHLKNIYPWTKASNFQRYLVTNKSRTDEKFQNWPI